jgi:hypothetical protein
MDVLSPSEALEILKARSSGQEMLLLVCKGQEINQLKNFAIHYLDRYGKQLPADYLESIDNPEGQSVVMAPSRISDDLAAALRLIAASLADDVFAAGLINQDCPAPLSFAQAVIDGAAMNQFGWRVDEYEGDGCTVFALPGYLMACETILRYLAKQQKTEKELPSDHTSEQQIAEKSTCRDGKKQSKHDVYLKRLEKWRLGKCKKDPRYLDNENREAFIKQYMVINLYGLTGPQLNEEINFMLTDCNEEQLPKFISITNSTSSIYANWSKHRPGSGRKAGSGGSSNIERDQQAANVCQAGLRNGKPDEGRIELTRAERFRLDNHNEILSMLDKMDETYREQNGSEIL